MISITLHTFLLPSLGESVTLIHFKLLYHLNTQYPFA